MNGEIDPRVMLVYTLVSLGLATANQIRKVWSGDPEMDDAKLDAIMAEADARLARRG